MGKKKIQIKKIENTTNRQVTYSKRRNGLIKKAYEIYVLCGVDVALILFSPSGKVNLFSGNKRIEDVLWRYVSLPVYERGRLHDEELLHRTLDNMRAEVDPTTLAPSPKSIDVQAKEIQHEIDISQHQLDEMEKRLRIFEGDPTRITSLREVEYNEHIIEETLNHVRACMLVLEEKNVSPGIQPNKQPQNVNANGFVTGNPIPNHPLNWVPSTDPQPQAHNILDSNGLLPSRDQTQPLGAFLPQPSTFHHENYMHLGNHMNTSSGVLNKRDVGFIDGNPPQWNEFNTIGNGIPHYAQPRGGAFLDLLLSELTP